MQIKFYIGFWKRENSTKRPDDSLNTPTVLNGHIKEPCDMLHPVISFQTISEQTTPTVYIYAHIPIFGRYYFVSNWSFEGGLWVVHLTVDVLASYRTNIGNTSAYIERASANADGTQSYYDRRVIDRAYPAKHEYTLQRINIIPSWYGQSGRGFNVSDGTYILGVVSKTTLGNVGGAVQYYAMDYNQIRALLNYMLVDQFYSDAGFNITMTANQQISHDVAKCLVNPIQYITSCMWFPCYVEDIVPGTPSLTTIAVGPWTTIGQGCPLTDYVGYRQSFTFELPVHPQSDARGAYLNYSPYSEFTCYMPPFGTFPIDPVFVDNLATRTVTVDLDVDGITGKGTIHLYRNDPVHGREEVCYMASTQFGVPIQLAQITSDYMGTATSLLQAGANLVGVGAQAYAGNVAGAIQSGVNSLSSIGNAVQSAMPQVITNGVNGSFLSITKQIGASCSVTAKFTMLVDEDLAEMGRPLCKVRQIDTFSGFVKCGEASIDYPAFDTEKTMIHRFMIDGFFWE